MAEIARSGGKRQYSNSLAARIAELHQQGLSREAVAREAGCTLRTVDRWRQENGVSAPASSRVGRPVDADRLERARLLFEEGASRREVRRTLGMNHRTISRHFPGTGWSREQSAEATAMSRKLRAL